MTQHAAGPTEVVEAFLDAFAAMDFDTALTFLSDDVEYTNIPIGTVYGHWGVRQVLEPFFAPIRENEFLISRRAASGEVVFIERLDRHRLDFGWRELPVNSVFEVHDGKVTVWRDYFDLATAAKIHDADAA
ncbi:MAG TPA: limonene-1,2-epoxide hydrolase family protein [Ilumatobacteraceae bacterium]|nr:limonene-1,2-epoxide hydrolase family protein [Ilumatobacteraceae bacterium]